jgi:hypothetical protein
VNGHPSGRGQAKIYIRKRKRTENEFESPILIKQLVSSMGITDEVAANIVTDEYPRILYRKNQNAWFIEYSNNTVSDIQTIASSNDDASSAWGGGTDSQETNTNNNTENKLQDEEIRENPYHINGIFKNDSRNKLVLSRVLK